MSIPVSCKCGKQFVAGDYLAGKRVKCPSCGGPIAVPANRALPQQESTHEASQFVVVCQCGQRFLAKQHLFGKTVPCPKCAKPIIVASPAATSKFQSMPDPFADPHANPSCDPLSGFDSDQSGLPFTDADFSQVPPQPIEPGSTATASPRPAIPQFIMTSPPMPRRRPTTTRRSKGRPQGMGLGVAWSIVASLIGAVVWLVLVFSTGYEFGIVAWGMGGLVGLAMALGAQDADDLSGIVAAAIAVLGILGVKIVMLVAGALALSAVASGEINDPELQNTTMGDLVLSTFGFLDFVFIALAAYTAFKVGSRQSSD